MEHTRKVPLLVSLGALTFALLVAIGSSWIEPSAPSPELVRRTLVAQHADPAPDVDAMLAARAKQEEPPGFAVPALGYFDGILVLTVALLVGSNLLPSFTTRVQGPVRLVVAFGVAIAGICAGFKAFMLLMLMVSMFLAAPFGTIAYLARWGFFDTDTALAALSLSVVLKVVFLVVLVVASLRFLENKTLLVMVAFSLLSNLIASFLFGLVPGIFASIVDVAAAVLSCIFGVLGSVIVFFGSIGPAIKALRPAPRS